MLEMSAKTANLLYGFKEGGGSGYPCVWCGVLTTLIDAEHITVCAEHQREYGEIGFAKMGEKYPLFDKDERNPEFFKAQRERHLKRARELTPQELTMITEYFIQGGKEVAQKVLDGIVVSEDEMEFLGYFAEDQMRWE